MAITDARILRSVKISETKGEKQTIQLSATEDYLVICDQKNPNFNDIMTNEADWPNLGGGKLPQIDDEITLSGITLYVTSREFSYYKDNERAVVMSVRYDAKAEPDGGSEQPEGSDPETWQKITIAGQQVTKPAIGWSRLEDVPAFSNAGQLPARNSAGDPVDGLEEESALVRLTYTNTQVLDRKSVV